MVQPKVEQLFSDSFEWLFLTDEVGHSILLSIVKATYVIQGKHLAYSSGQAPINLSGQAYGDPETTSYKYEPETAFVKPATDIVLIGHAHAPQPNTTELEVGIRIGPVQKLVRVFGDRYWLRTMGSYSMSSPQPFERIPLTYENAFGGWDRSHPDSSKHTFEPRNPVGIGFRRYPGAADEKIKLPNIEDPTRLIKNFGDTPPPAGFGFVSPNWQPRASLAGTYDEQWQRTRLPLLPTDFDRRFFNAASPGLIAPGYLKGDESVVILNASIDEPIMAKGVARRRLAFKLPGAPAPLCDVELRGGRKEQLQTRLDTVIINTDENLVFLIWRAHMIVPNGPHDVVAIKVWNEGEVPVAAAR